MWLEGTILESTAIEHFQHWRKSFWKAQSNMAKYVIFFCFYIWCDGYSHKWMTHHWLGHFKSAMWLNWQFILPQKWKSTTYIFSLIIQFMSNQAKLKRFTGILLYSAKFKWWKLFLWNIFSDLLCTKQNESMHR